MIYRVTLLLLVVVAVALLFTGKLRAGLRIAALIVLAAVIGVLAVVVLNLPHSPY